MRRLGFDRFALVGHDRGSDTAFRTAMDHPDAVERLATLDGVPIVEALERCDARFAADRWPRFFFAQPEKPERAILADPDARYGGCPERMGAEACRDVRDAIHDLERLYGEVLAVWRPWRTACEGRGLDCGHHLAEEIPDLSAETLAESPLRSSP